MEKQSTQQLRLSLSDATPAGTFFVPHSGVADAMQVLDEAMGKKGFRFFHITGPRGSGKSELLTFGISRASAPFAAFDFSSAEPDDERVASFISAYESLKAAGGMLLVAGGEAARNPHVTSRLSFAVPLELGYPREEELYPLVRALLERRGLRFPDSILDYLIQRLPADPLSLSNIFAKIDELSLAQGRQTNRALIREALEPARSKDGADF